MFQQLRTLVPHIGRKRGRPLKASPSYVSRPTRAGTVFLPLVLDALVNSGDAHAPADAEGYQAIAALDAIELV
jgi:hypothetical protein